MAAMGAGEGAKPDSGKEAGPVASLPFLPRKKQNAETQVLAFCF